MNDTPKRARTTSELNDRSAPACTEVGLEVKGNVRVDVFVERIVILVDEDAEDWKVPDSRIDWRSWAAGESKS